MWIVRTWDVDPSSPPPAPMVFEVGYYAPDDAFVRESAHANEAEAIARAAFLNGSGPLQPLPTHFHPWNERKEFPGIDLRSWFAGLAMQGLLARLSFKETPSDMAALAVRYADALLLLLSRESAKGGTK